MLNEEYKLLKYINKHPHITYKALVQKFDTVDIFAYSKRFGDYIEYTGLEETKDENGNFTGGFYFKDDASFYLSRPGMEYIEKKRRDFLTFFLPYAITTLIALSSVIFEILRMFIF